jgi:hypothetical protein
MLRTAAARDPLPLSPDQGGSEPGARPYQAGGTVREQRPHLPGEVVKTITKQVRRRERARQIARQDAFAVSREVGSTWDEELLRNTEAGPDQHILEAAEMHPRSTGHFQADSEATRNKCSYVAKLELVTTFVDIVRDGQQ